MMLHKSQFDQLICQEQQLYVKKEEEILKMSNLNNWLCVIHTSVFVYKVWMLYKRRSFSKRGRDRKKDWIKTVLNDELKNTTGVRHLGIVFSLFKKSVNRPQTVKFTWEKSPHRQATNKLLSFTHKDVFKIAHII